MKRLLIFLFCTSPLFGISQPESFGFQKGLDFIESGDYQGAIEAFSGVLARYPNDLNTHFNRGLAHEGLEMYEEAIKDYDIVLKQDAFNQKALWHRGSCRYILGEFQSAAWDFTGYLKTIPKAEQNSDTSLHASRAYYLRGLAYTAQGKADQAISDFRRSVETNPPSLPALFELANIKYDNGDFKGAIKNLTTYIEITPDAEAYNNRGLARAELGNSQSAIEDFSSAISYDSTNAHFYYNRGFEKFLLEDHEGASKDFTKTLELEAEYQNALYYRGKVYYELGEYDNAKADLEKLVELFPDDSEAKDLLFAARLTGLVAKHWLYLILFATAAISALVFIVRYFNRKSKEEPVSTQ